MLRNPHEFGKKFNPEFVEETGANVTQVSGAMVQHAFAKGINDALLERGMSLVTLSELTRLNYQRLTRMLRGSVLMRLDDIGLIARALPEAFDPVVGKYDPRARFNTETPTKSRRAQILDAAWPLTNPALREAVRQQQHEGQSWPEKAKLEQSGTLPSAKPLTSDLTAQPPALPFPEMHSSATALGGHLLKPLGPAL
jgi:hypothetical protein